MIKRSIITYLLLFAVSAAFAQSWMEPWQNRQLISIINYNLSNLDEFQVRLEVPYHECMDSNFADLRFVEKHSGEVLKYWIQHVTPMDKAVVYIKAPYLPLYATTDFYMYFGNAIAESNSDPYETFLYYDDFDTNVGWNNIGDELSINISTLSDGTTVLTKNENCDESGAWKSLGTTISDFKLISRDYRGYMLQRDLACNMHAYGIETPDYSGVNFRRDGSNTDGISEIGLHDTENGEQENISLAFVPQPTDKWYYTEVSYGGICLFNTNALMWDENMNILANVYNFNYEMFEFDRFVIRGGQTYMLDYIAVAKKVCIEPMASFLEIEDCPRAELVSYAGDYCEEEAGQIIYTVTGGEEPYNVCYYLDGDSITSLQVMEQDTVTLSGLGKGVYSISIKDTNGCLND